MAKINVILQNGEKVAVESGASFYDILKEYNSDYCKTALAVKVNNIKKDLFDIPHDGDKIEVVTYQDKEGKEIFFHSSSHIMAQAVQEIFPGTKIAIGPAIEEGFYYDFDSEHIFSPEDFKTIEKKMKEIIRKNLPFQKKNFKREEAIRLFEQNGEIYKIELIKDIPDEEYRISTRRIF